MTRPLEAAREALAQYDRWRESINGGTTRTEDMLSEALRNLLSSELYKDRINHPKASNAEDDFGDASIQRAMVAARERGDAPAENKSRLVAESQVREAASEIWDDEGIELWLDHPNNMLSQMTPRQAVAAGNGFRVLAIIDGIADGVVW